jgi:hypothetical protein
MEWLSSKTINMLSKVLRKTVKVSKVMHPTQWEKVSPFHDI